MSNPSRVGSTSTDSGASTLPKYTQSREQSAEVFRMVLAAMSKHSAALNPITFAVWYEHYAGVNPDLSKALDALLADGAAIGDPEVAGLYGSYIAGPDLALVETVSTQLQELMIGIDETATGTGSRAGQYGDQLKALAHALVGKSASVDAGLVDDLICQTAEMQRSVDSLRAELSNKQEEISRLRQQLESARVEALLDPLTGILNRKGFDTVLARLTSEDSEAPGFSVALLDIDHFKQVNDKHGHLVGDLVLKGVGEILRSLLPGSLCYAARYGGEEFVILWQGASGVQCQELIERVRSRVAGMRLRSKADRSVVASITLSAGIACHIPLEAPHDTLGRADKALYESKAGGRDRVTLG